MCTWNPRSGRIETGLPVLAKIMRLRLAKRPFLEKVGVMDGGKALDEDLSFTSAGVGEHTHSHMPRTNKKNQRKTRKIVTLVHLDVRLTRLKIWFA